MTTIRDEDGGASGLARSTHAGESDMSNNSKGNARVFRPALMSTHAAGPREVRLIRLIVLFSVLLFVASLPFLRTPLPAFPAFMAVYDAALFVVYLITAVLLYSHGHTLCSRALMLLADGFLFVACIIVPHLLTFPDLFAPTGLLGAGLQSTAWLYQLWHGGFPLFVLLYVRQARRERRRTGTASLAVRPSVSRHIVASLAVAGAASLIALQQDSVLPVLMKDWTVYVRDMTVVSMLPWALNLLALWMLWRKRPHAALDLWLLVTLITWVLEVSMAALLNAGRYDLGFYVGRVNGLIAASLVLIALLIENGRLYAQLGRAHERMQQRADELERRSALDGLTGVANRRHFDLMLGREWRRALRSGLPLSLLMIDVDFFKHYNDRYGHLAGDRCLKEVAAALAGGTRRASDMVARYGGEEFAVLLPDTPAEDALRLAEAMRAAVQQLAVGHEGSAVSQVVTVSVGVATVRPGPVMATRRFAQVNADSSTQSLPQFTQLVDAADHALYRAKDGGRNRVEVAEAGAIIYQMPGSAR